METDKIASEVLRHRLSRRGVWAAGGSALLAWSVPTAATAQQVAGARTGKRIARVALKYKGARYRWGGNTPRGFDCSGFTQYVVRRVTGTDIGQGVPGQWQFGARAAKGRWRPGDLVFFANTSDRGLSHVGIYLGDNRFIHAENEQTGVVIDDIRSDYYASHYYGARRLA